MKPRFWKAATTSAGGPLTPELLQEAFDAMLKQLDEPPQRCPHIHPYGYVKKLRDCGDITAYCMSCGQQVRL